MKTLKKMNMRETIRTFNLTAKEGPDGLFFFTDIAIIQSRRKNCLGRKTMRERIKRGNVTVDIVMDEAVVCRPMSIFINNVRVNFFDLGRSKDLACEEAPPCGCGNRVFIPKKIQGYMEKKFHLKEGEGIILETILRERFSIGSCRKCN